MPYVQFTRHLRRYFPSLAACHVEAATAAEVVAELERRWPGMADFLLDERGALRRHVNLFIGEQPVEDRVHLSDAVPEAAEVFVLQALSGG